MPEKAEADVSSIFDVEREYVSPPPPGGISARAARFWGDIHNKWDFEPHEDVVLEELCHALTMIETLRGEQAALDLLVVDKVGRVSAAPLLGEMRQWAGVINTLLRSVKIPIVEPAKPTVDADGLPAGHAAGIQDAALRSAKMRALVNKRWHPEKGDA